MRLKIVLFICIVGYLIVSCISPNSRSIMKKLTCDGDVTCWDGYWTGYNLMFKKDTFYFYNYATSDSARIYEPMYAGYFEAVFLWKIRDSTLYILFPTSKEVAVKLKIIKFGKEQLCLYDKKGILMDEPDSLYFF